MMSIVREVIKINHNEIGFFIQESAQIIKLYVCSYEMLDNCLDNNINYRSIECAEIETILNGSNIDLLLENIADDSGEIEIEKQYLNSVQVEKQYQNNGIGKKLVQLALKYLDLKKIACVEDNCSYQYSLTSAGEKLIASCLKKQIISPKMCIFSGQTTEILASKHLPDPGKNVKSIQEIINNLLSAGDEKKQAEITHFFNKPPSPSPDLKQNNSPYRHAPL